MMKKQLIIAVEGTAGMGLYWKTIIFDYLEKMIRSFTEADSIKQNPSAGDTELLLLVFNAHGLSSGCTLQRSGWTRNIDMFSEWLSVLPFSGGGFNDVAVAEGLAEALMLFSSLNGSQTQRNADGRRHCILVAASNPSLLPTPVNGPVTQILKQSGIIEAHTSNVVLADAETVAKAFPQCSVSLSVICPRKLPKLRAIYKAGKRDPQAADPPVDTSKNPNFLVLISENFSEACAAFSNTEVESLAPNQSLVEMDMSSVPPVSGPTATSNPSVLNQEPISAGNIPAATVNSEPPMVTSVSGPAPPQIPISQVAASSQSGLPISVSKEMVLNNENTKETTPIVSVVTQSLGPFSGAAANVGILNGVTSAIPAAPAVLTSGQQGVTSMTGFAPFGRTSQIAQNSVTILTSGHLGVTSMSGFSPFAITDQIAQNFVPASLTSMAPNMSGNSSPCISQLLSNIEEGIGAHSQTTPVMSRGNDAKLDRHAPAQMMHSRIGMHENVPSGMATGMPLGIDATLPTPGRTQQRQPGILPLGRNNSAEANMSGNSNLGISQMLSDIIGAGSQTATVMSQGNLPRSQMMQSGIGMHQNVPSGMATGMCSGIDTTMPNPGRTQQGQPEILPLGRNNSAEANMSGNSNLGISQMLSDIIGAGSQTAPVMSEGNFPRSQMMQNGIGRHQNVLSGMGTGMLSGIGTMMPTPGMTGQGQSGILPLGRNNTGEANMEANMSLSHQQTLATLPSAQSGYAKFWEGNLYVPRLVEPVMRLQGYKRASASESLSANWPPTMQIQHVISKEHMNEHVRQRTERTNVLVFLAMEPHALLNLLQEGNQCAVISLPSQRLILEVSDETSRLIGFLLPSENTELRPTIPNQQLRATPLPQLQQQQQRAQPLLEQLQQQRAQLQQQQRAQLQEQRALPLLAQLPQQPPRLMKRQHDVLLQQQSKLPRICGQEIPQQQPVVTTTVHQAYMPVTVSSQLVSQTQASSSVLPSLPEIVLVDDSDDDLYN